MVPNIMGRPPHPVKSTGFGVRSGYKLSFLTYWLWGLGKFLKLTVSVICKVGYICDYGG